MKKFLIIVSLFALMALPILADETHPLWSDVAVGDLTATCSSGHLIGLDDGRLAVCNSAGDGWNIFYPEYVTHPTYAEWTAAGLPTCNSSEQYRIRVDASGDLCYCDGSSWNLLQGTSCDVTSGEYLLMEDGVSYVLMETGDKIILESSP